MNANKKLTIVLASGGTGGHIFPAESLAEELVKRGHKAILVTDSRREQYTFTTKNNIEVYVVSSKSSKGGIIGKATALFSILRGWLQAARLLKKLKPDVV